MAMNTEYYLYSYCIQYSILYSLVMVSMGREWKVKADPGFLVRIFGCYKVITPERVFKISFQTKLTIVSTVFLEQSWEDQLVQQKGLFVKL